MDPNAFIMGGGMQMQQAPPQPPNDQQQLLNRIVQELNKNPPQSGWQANFSSHTRAVCIINL